jgi:hypothetical protein
MGEQDKVEGGVGFLGVRFSGDIYLQGNTMIRNLTSRMDKIYRMIEIKNMAFGEKTTVAGAKIPVPLSGS